MTITQDSELDWICRAKTGVGVELDQQNLIVVGVGVELKWSIPGVGHLC